MKKIAVVQSSLREGSHTDVVCKIFAEKAKDAGLDIEYIDLRGLEMDLCDGRDFGGYSKDLQDAYARMEPCEVIIFGMPVYQYSMSEVLKNFIDICGGAIEWNIVGAIVNAWGPNCYMASRDLFNSLQFEYACPSVMPTPYSWSMDFKDWELVSKKVEDKLEELIEKIMKL